MQWTRCLLSMFVLCWYCSLVCVADKLANPSGMEGSVSESTSFADFWLVKFMLNVAGYATLIIPAYFLIKYLKRTGYNEKAGHGLIPTIVRLCVFGRSTEISPAEDSGSSLKTQAPQPERSQFMNVIVLCFCFVGLQGSYLTWGVLQERIMTHEYKVSDSEPAEKFKNSQFLVFMNRVLAFVAACMVLAIRQQPRHTAPLYSYSFCSISNIMSSWCQYEALKFVTFPTQVLVKASKTIPVMLMGKLVSKKTFQTYEYLTAAMISLGVAMFLLSSSDESKHKKAASVTTFSGVLIMAGYLGFDSFTSNWQGALFSKHKMTSFQMMAGVNLFSCLFTSIALIEQGGFTDGVSFMLKYPLFLTHVCTLSLCSAIGQLFIYYTISQFGPVTFTIIMTIRMALSILLSCVIYGHPVTAMAFLGILVVFVAIFLRIYCNQRARALKKMAARADSDQSTVSKV